MRSRSLKMFLVLLLIPFVGLISCGGGGGGGGNGNGNGESDENGNNNNNSADLLYEATGTYESTNYYDDENGLELNIISSNFPSDECILEIHYIDDAVVDDDIMYWYSEGGDIVWHQIDNYDGEIQGVWEAEIAGIKSYEVTLNVDGTFTFRGNCGENVSNINYGSYTIYGRDGDKELNIDRASIWSEYGYQYVHLYYEGHVVGLYPDDVLRIGILKDENRTVLGKHEIRRGSGSWPVRIYYIYEDEWYNEGDSYDSYNDVNYVTITHDEVNRLAGEFKFRVSRDGTQETTVYIEGTFDIPR